MTKVFRVPRRPDWDAVLTLTLSVLAFLLTAGIALLPALNHVLRVARDSPDHPETADRILVFGKRLRQRQPDEEYVERLQKTVQILRSLPQALVILMGGSARAGELSEAEAGRLYLCRLGVPVTARIGLEQESRHTLDNLRNARDDFPGLEDGGTVLVSSRYHLARCSLIADSLGIDHRVCAADEPMTFDVANAKRLLVEAFFVHWFKTGRFWARLTGNRRMLSRIT